ncbi:MAG: hypothetical protein KF901_30860 [Myxococcales bacterium]|nr:hypothetical protein [Myxococcales bacterium]
MKAPDPLFGERGDAVDATVERIRWLVRLRWGAMAGALLASLLAVVGVAPGVAWPVTSATALLGLAYNAWLHRGLRRRTLAPGPRAALVQALIDLGMLTVFLWSAGGVHCPFIGFYIFHVALIAILGGPRWALLATAAAFTGAGLLAVTNAVPALQIGVWAPTPPFGLVADVVAFVTTVSGAAYIVTHAVNELRDRERALALARDHAALEYQLLSNTLDELEAGLEVVDGDGAVLWRNRRAEELAPFGAVGAHWECPGERRACERDVTGVCPVHAAHEAGAPGRCRFAAKLPTREERARQGPDERVYEMLVFPIDAGDHPRVMNLYVDRTQATLAERQLLLAERLASLGRVAQGVAHELNTPLATIRTLAADMRRALEAVGDALPQDVRVDLDESATLIRDETGRLGRITQALLAGGDLVRATIDDQVPLAAAVERSRAIVSAGSRGGPRVEVDAGVSEHEVAADMDRLVQVLVNLLQNAVDASRAHGGSLVRVHAEARGDEVAVVVTDDGAGLLPEVRGRLFEPFATTKPPGEGTGLGLYTSYMLVDAMGGRLELDDAEGGGARATVTLPRAIRRRRLDVVPSARSSTRAPAATGTDADAGMGASVGAGADATAAGADATAALATDATRDDRLDGAAHAGEAR